ncbi:hypothetical protein MMC22_003912 [Lobaria immixta]|nr:hypothetical protein [Lobaria immixta]
MLLYGYLILFIAGYGGSLPSPPLPPLALPEVGMCAHTWYTTPEIGNPLYGLKDSDDSNLATTAIATTSSSNPDNDQIVTDLPTTYGQIFANTLGEADGLPTNGEFSQSSDPRDIYQQISSESV